MNAHPSITFLYWRECPSHERALDRLRREMADLGLDPQRIELEEIRTEQDAQLQRFPGSPTIRVDGRDVAGAVEEPFALNCRIYRKRDGRVGPTPDPQDVRDALRAAIERQTA